MAQQCWRCGRLWEECARSEGFAGCEDLEGTFFDAEDELFLECVEEGDEAREDPSKVHARWRRRLREKRKNERRPEKSSSKERLPDLQSVQEGIRQQGQENPDQPPASGRLLEAAMWMAGLLPSPVDDEQMEKLFGKREQGTSEAAWKAAEVVFRTGSIARNGETMRMRLQFLLVRACLGALIGWIMLAGKKVSTCWRGSWCPRVWPRRC